jgi:hypothetical protein
VPDTQKSTEDPSSDKLSQKHDVTLAPDYRDQATEQMASSDADLISKRSSEFVLETQPEETTLFGVDILPVSSKQKLTSALPHFITLDVDLIRTDSRIEKYLRKYQINMLYKPSSGILTKESLFEVAFQEPVQVIRRDGYYWCIAGEGLLAEANRILIPPRSLPVLQRSEFKKDSLLYIAVVEQIIQPARHQMEQVFFKARVPLIISCAKLLPTLFVQALRDDQWAAILGRSLRWFASAKKSCEKEAPENGN